MDGPLQKLGCKIVGYKALRNLRQVVEQSQQIFNVQMEEEVYIIQESLINIQIITASLLEQN